MQSKVRKILENENHFRADHLGPASNGPPIWFWWTGSDLIIEEARRLAPGPENATTLAKWLWVLSRQSLRLFENPKKRSLMPDDLPHDFVLDISQPYLGNFISTPIRLDALKNRKTTFLKENPAVNQQVMLWQFENLNSYRNINSGTNIFTNNPKNVILITKYMFLIFLKKEDNVLIKKLKEWANRYFAL